MISIDSFRDDPTDGTRETDELNRYEFAETIAKVIRDIRSKDSSSSVLGLVGDWGSGKSSVLAMVEKILKKSDDSWSVVDFNPWSYSNENAITLGFFKELNGAFTDAEDMKDARKALGQLASSFSWLGVATTPWGFDSSGALKGIGKLITGDGESRIKAKTEEAIRALKRPILVVIDDLDRLDTQELLLLFKLIRLVGRLPNIYYLLGYDERTLTSLLCATPGISDGERAQDFLEKVVQVRFDMPQLTENQVSSITYSLLENMTTKHSLQLSPSDVSRLEFSYQQCLSIRFNSPRSIRRFFMQVEASFSSLKGEVDFVDFLQITWLRTFYPELYVELHSLKYSLTKPITDLMRTPGEYSQVSIDWQERIRKSLKSPEDLRPLMKLLGNMFYPIRATANSGNSGENFEQIGKRLGIGNSDYFDRYFIFGIPREDLANERVELALRDLDTIGESLYTSELRQFLELNPNSATQKIEVVLEKGIIHPLSVLEFLKSEFPLIEKDPSNPFNGSNSISGLARRILSNLDFPSLSLFVSMESKKPEEILFNASLIDSIIRGGNLLVKLSAAKWEEWKLRVSREIILALDARSPGASNDFDDFSRRIFWIWSRIEPSYAATWFKSKKAEWGTMGSLMRLVPSGYGNSGGGVIPVLFELEPEMVEQFYGLDQAKLDLAGQFEASNIRDLPTYPLDTHVNRQEFVFRALRKS